MSKVICDICGTTYPETADQCPICGFARDMSVEMLDEELLEEEAPAAAPRGKGGRFAASKSDKRKQKRSRYEEPEEDKDDEDELDEEYDDDDEYYESDYDDDDDDEDDEDEEEHKSNAPLVVLLIIVIAALVAVSSFIFVKYFLPNMQSGETTAATTTAPTVQTGETTEPTIPCENLALTSGGEVVLKAEGDNWLINVLAMPEDTTDVLTYVSSDESVATVNEQGRITAVGEGTAVITITCGEKSLECTVTCDFAVEETTVPETEVTEPATEPEEEGPKGTVISKTPLKIRSGAGTGNEQVGSYENGTRITILEQKDVNGTIWGRTSDGWVSLDYVAMDEENFEPFTGTVTINGLNIRAGIGTDTESVGKYNEGDQVTILAVTSVAGARWGLTEDGWVSMNYIKE